MEPQRSSIDEPTSDRPTSAESTSERDPVLAEAHAREAAKRSGRLRIFFGYAAGVGKTYAMLEAARQAIRDGRDVVVGYVEPHARPDTQSLATGLPVVPVKEIEYRGVTLRELDVDAALARRPEVLLVDELAHSNAPSSRHDKRWQDVHELLEAGINVWTTLNVQHIESLNDVIGQITGISVRETIPDAVFDSADAIELVDITPDELQERLRAGKVYLPAQAQEAMRRFFQHGNLAALREMSLRQAARRVHTDVETARQGRASARPWATAERLLVCVGPSPTTARVIRTAKRMAAAFDSPWLAVSVDVTGQPASDAVKHQIAHHFRLAERLGAETVTLVGESVTSAVLDFARSRNVTKILVGKTSQPRWRRLLFGAVVDELLERSGEIDVYVIQGAEEEEPRVTRRPSAARGGLSGHVQSALAIVGAGLLALGLRHVHVADSEANTVMLFLAAVAWSAVRHGRGPAIVASALAVLVFDFFFVPPRFTFAVADAQYVVTFAVMLAIGLVISTLAARLRAQIESSRARERRTAALYELGKQLSSLYGELFLARATGANLADLTGGEAAVYLLKQDGAVEVAYGEKSLIATHSVSSLVAQWVVDHDQIAGAGTNTLPNAVALFLPVTGSQRTHGAIAVRATDVERLLDPDLRRLLESCASQLALALERDRLAIAAADARVKIEAEQVRSSLLSSVSHDLKTPLAAIAGATGSLLESNSYSVETRRELLETISSEAARLTRLLENILQMSKLDAGAAAPNRQWHVVEELVGSALQRTRRELAARSVSVRLPVDLPLVFIDGLLIEQVFVNLLENAARHTPVDSSIEIAAAIDGRWLRISVTDDGPGLPAGAEQRVFEKFFRASPHADAGRGSGLGLAICHAIVAAHGGQITAANRPSRGAEFIVRLPLSQGAPRVAVE